MNDEIVAILQDYLKLLKWTQDNAIAGNNNEDIADLSVKINKITTILETNRFWGNWDDEREARLEHIAEGGHAEDF